MMPWCELVGGGWDYCTSSGAATPAPAPPAGGFGSTSGDDGWVADHNHFRRLHGADDVSWNSDLAKKAKDWAQHLHNVDSMYHSNHYETWPVSGENLAWGYGGCSAATGDGGPSLYSHSYDQHCAVASWYGEYYLWRGTGNWQNVNGLGHFTAMVWKGINRIGCASEGHYYVCEYGSTHCMGHASPGDYGGQSCWASTPSHLPNFNKGQCSGGACVEALFGNLSVPLLGDLEKVEGRAGSVVPKLAVGGTLSMLAMAAIGVARKWRVRDEHRMVAQEQLEEELEVPTTQSSFQ